MSVRAVLALVLTALAVVYPHVAFAVAVIVIAGPILVLGHLILSIVLQTGWGVVPVRRSLT